MLFFALVKAEMHASVCASLVVQLSAVKNAMHNTIKTAFSIHLHSRLLSMLSYIQIPSATATYRI